MDGLRLDGNAAAGALGEAMFYEVRGLDTILRCPGCDSAPDSTLIRLAHVRARNLVDLGETSYLATG